jgi:TRAP-type transport system small permease protein
MGLRPFLSLIPQSRQEGVQPLIDRLERLLAATVNVCGLVLFVSLTLLLALNITLRSLPFLKLSLVWTDEAIRFLFIWLCFVGSALAMMRAQHIEITFLVERLPTGLQHLLRLVRDIVVILFLAGMIHAGVTLVKASSIQHSISLGLPMGWVQAVLPAAGAVMLLSSLLALLRDAGSALTWAREGGRR